ncbi:MAG: hypothetical protein RLZZ412_1496 [Verrucomicrobiota bacterium]
MTTDIPATDTPTTEPDTQPRATSVAEALEKWSKRCEMKGTIEAAIGLARKMLTVDADLLDADPWLLNCANGVVDLRSGQLRPHDPALLMTRSTGTHYQGADYTSGPPGAPSYWAQVVLTICGGDPELAGFLRRWFGYASTGSVREQVFVVHWGDGANGKSTILDTVAATLGDYAMTAASGMLAGSSGHGASSASGEAAAGAATPEVAALRGRRMVTAHETSDGVTLREGFVKRVTGGDRIVARQLYGDPFEFQPTHKLQLLTNSRPVVRGQDHGIWRRVRLVPYLVRFGTPEDVAAGHARAVRDLALAERLATPEMRSEVLGWLVRGAVEWATTGLREPTVVLEASEAYRREQDRVGTFVHECCEVDTRSLAGGAAGAAGAPDRWAEPLTLGMGGLYPAYASWCKDAGAHPLSRQRFLAEVQRAVPGLVVRDAGVKGEGGRRRTVTLVTGLRLLPD